MGHLSILICVPSAARPSLNLKASVDNENKNTFANVLRPRLRK
jgi:hypothetical protein